jgi:UDP-N-acetyl-D-mannosaminuronic acid dehydrogenase
LKDKICVIGLGYVGLPTALILAKKGYSVFGVDIDQQKIKSLQKNYTTIEDASSLLENKLVRKNFQAQHNIPSVNSYIVAVPTPLKSNNHANLQYLTDAIKSICTILKKGNLIIVESTIPPGTCRNIIGPLIEKHTKLKINEDFFLSHCPERAIPTNTVYEIIHNDRIIGGVNIFASKKTEKIYKSFVKGKIHITDDITAEMTKLVENSYRDVNIAFANEIDTICSKLKISTKDVIRLANKHPRVNILEPGIGVGGHCIPIDPLFISQIAPQKSKIIKLARKINDNKPSSIAKQILFELKDIKNPSVVVGGISYKKNVNDIRESPALKIIEYLKAKNIKVTIHDPIVYPKNKSNLLKLCEKKDLLVILVSHDKIINELKTNEKQIRSILNSNKVLMY